MASNVPEWEITSLRRLESATDEMACEADRLVRQLMAVYKCDFVIDNNIPLGAWVPLPEGWQQGVENVEIKFTRLSPAHRGTVAVHLNTLRYLRASM